MIKTVTLETGKTYRLFTSNGRYEVLTTRVHAETHMQIWQRVTSERIKGKIDAELALIEAAGDSDVRQTFYANPGWQRQLIATSHRQALEMDAELSASPTSDRAFNAYWFKCECMDLLTASRIWCQIRQEALEMNLNVINQQIRADAYNRPENRCLVDELHGYALRQNAGIDRAVEIIRALALDPCAGDAAGGCLYRDGHDDINYLVEVALRIVGPFMYMRPSATNIVSRTDGKAVWWWSARRQIWIKDKECAPDVFANIVATGNGFYCGNPEVKN